MTRDRPRALGSFYDRFFGFWRDATRRLLDESAFTFEDQKYWTYLDLNSRGPEGKAKARPQGAARYNHILVDEFQDINPLDLQLVRALAERNQATLTIVGDDDQAIFEWRGRARSTFCIPKHTLALRLRNMCYRSTTGRPETSSNCRRS